MSWRVFVPMLLIALALFRPAHKVAAQLPPDRFFGAVVVNGSVPAPGTPVVALIEGRVCGEGEVKEDGRYVVDVPDAATVAGCGVADALVTFQVGGVLAAQTGVFNQGDFTNLDLAGPRAAAEATLGLADPRPCIPDAGEAACSAGRAALWNGDQAAWAAQGITDDGARLEAIILLRVNSGDQAAIRNIARILGNPYMQITRLRFIGSLAGQTDEFIEITNLGGGAQDMTGWTVRSPSTRQVAALPAGLVLGPGQSCRVYTGDQGENSCGVSFGSMDVWPDNNGVAVLYYDALDLPGASTLYNADPANQPPPPNLQLSEGGVGSR